MPWRACALGDNIMKKIGAFQLGFTFAGCFLGAGYVSGQELWQFFGAFGNRGWIGMVVAMTLLGAIGLLMLDLNRRTHIYEVDGLILPFAARPLHWCVACLEMLFLFGVAVIMSAGAGALANQLFGLPLWLGCLLFTLLSGGLSLGGRTGMITAFSRVVPILVAVTLCFGLYTLFTAGICPLPAPAKQGNPLMSTWVAGTLTFASYNIFGAIPVTAPMGRHLKNRATLYWGTALGTLVILLIAASVLLSIAADPACAQAELPMLQYAQDQGAVFGYVYGVLLLLAMLVTTLSCLVAFVGTLQAKFPKIEFYRREMTAISSALMFFAGLLGFGDLIGVIYPIFGYASSVFILLMAVHYIKVRRSPSPLPAPEASPEG